MGITMSTPSNKSMVDELVDKHQYIMSPVVEGAFRAVDRAMYFNLEEGDTFDPYSETPWRDGNIHLSAPCIYAKAVEALDLQPGHSFLNLGSGTGYLNTIVGLIIGPHGINHGIEYHSDVVQYAQERLKRFKRESFAIDKYDFAEPLFIHGDCVKLNPNSSYDRVYLGAACTQELETFMKKLIKPAGGVLVMPLDCYLLRYIRITEVDWKVEKLMQVSFTLMIREPRGGEDDNKMIDMPLAQPRSLKELCRIHIRRNIRDKTNHENPNLLNSDNIAARKRRKAVAERKMQMLEALRRNQQYRACPYSKEGNDSNGRSSKAHRNCRRWPCREFNDFMAKAPSSDEDRIMTRSARRRFELSRIFNRYRSDQSADIMNEAGRTQHVGSRSQGQNSSSGSDSSSSYSRGTVDGNQNSSRVTRGEGCSRTRPFVSRFNRAQQSVRERAPSPARLGEPYRVTRGAFPATRRSDIHRINYNSYHPVFMSSPSTHSDSSSSSSTRQNEEEYYRHPTLPDLPSLFRIRRLASRALINSIFEPIPNALDEIDDDDSDYEQESDDEDSFDDDFNDPDLSGLESFEEDIISDEDDDSGEDSDEDSDNDSDSASASDSDSGSDDDDNDDDDDDDQGVDDNDDDDRDFNPNQDRGGQRRDHVGPHNRVTRSVPLRAHQVAAIHEVDCSTVSNRLVCLRSSSTPTVTTSTSFTLSQPSCDNLSINCGNQFIGRGSSSYGVTTTSPSTATTDRYHCHKQQFTDRKRKRQSSSSSCSEASNTSSPNKRGGRSVAQVTRQCHDNRDTGRQTSRVRRCCGCPQGLVASENRRHQPLDTEAASSLSHLGSGYQLETSASEGTKKHSDASEPDTLSNSLDTGHRWTRLRSLISARAKNYARQVQTSSGGVIQSAPRLIASSRNNRSASETIIAAQEAPSLTQHQSDCSAPEASAMSNKLESALSRCHHHHHRHHHCHSHGHHRHHHHRYCCSNHSFCRVGAIPSCDQQSGSAEIGSLSVVTSRDSSASTSFPPACRGFREPGGRLNDSQETKERQRCRSKKKNQRRVRSENECQRYHNHMSAYISQLPVPQVLQSYLNFDRDKF